MTSTVLANSPKDRSPSLNGVRILDSETIEIRLIRPSAYFLYQLSHPVSFVVDADETAEPEWFRSPNSSGPFKLAAWQSGEEIVLERNGNYHSPPRLSSVRVALIGVIRGVIAI